MPLKTGTDDATIQQNIKKLIAEGYAPDQAAAIAHEKAGRMMKPDMDEDEMMMHSRRTPRNLSRWFDS